MPRSAPITTEVPIAAAYHRRSVGAPGATASSPAHPPHTCLTPAPLLGAATGGELLAPALFEQPRLAAQLLRLLPPVLAAVQSHVAADKGAGRRALRHMALRLRAAELAWQGGPIVEALMRAMVSWEPERPPPPRAVLPPPADA